jgi:hypothetical protein
LSEAPFSGKIQHWPEDRGQVQRGLLSHELFVLPAGGVFYKEGFGNTLTMPMIVARVNGGWFHGRSLSLCIRPTTIPGAM